MEWDQLHEEIGHAIEFRKRKAEEYPDDERNQGAIEALQTVESELAKCAGDHPAWRKIEQEFTWLLAHSTYPDMCDFEEWHRYISRFGGFDGGEGLDQFLDGLLEMIREWQNKIEYLGESQSLQ